MELVRNSLGSSSLRRQRQFARTIAKRQRQQTIEQKRLDRQVVKLTGIPNMTFRRLVAALENEHRITYNGAKKKAHQLLGGLEIIRKQDEKEQEQQWRFKVVMFP